jgi:hypothetical protein
MRHIYMFKYVNGVKTKFRFSLDDEGVIVDEIQVPDESQIQKEQMSQKEHLLKSRGYEFHYDAEGKMVIDKVPTREAKIMTFFSPSSPCWFTGCEELRQEYYKELAKIDTPGCPQCMKGSLIRKYQDKIREMWKEEA